MLGSTLVVAFLVVGLLRPVVSAQEGEEERIAALETAVAELTTRVAELEGTEGGSVVQSDALDAILTPQVRPDPTATPEPEPTEVPTPTPAAGTSLNNPVPIGTTLEGDGLAVTVLSAYYDFSFANAIPRGGYKLLIAEVSIENVGDGGHGYAAADFSGEDADTGVGYNAVTLDNVGVLLGSGDLEPGEFVSGTVLIEVQETAARVILKYDPRVFDPNDLFWIFQ